MKKETFFERLFFRLSCVYFCIVVSVYVFSST